MNLTIIDYGAGNTHSVANAIKEIADSSLQIKLSNQPSDLKSATHFILPGVGAFADCINGLKAVEGLLPELRSQLLKHKKPFLGICVGMQVLASIGTENGEHQGLGLINGRVEKISDQILNLEEKSDENQKPEASKEALKIPHMGWNGLIIKNEKHPLLKEIKQGEHFYFANSFHFVCQNENNVLAQFEHGLVYCAMIAKENIAGVQFHPEKSGESGLKFLGNFLNWRP